MFNNEKSAIFVRFMVELRLVFLKKLAHIQCTE